jgi:hypothetical protein
VTTDCHWNEIKDLAHVVARPIYTVSLDPSFPRTVARNAGRRPVLMVVRDSAFEGVFRRLLAQLGTSAETLARLRIVEPARAVRLLREPGASWAVHVSPLVSHEMRSRIPHEAHRICARWSVGTSALERLRASLALQLALSV